MEQKSKFQLTKLSKILLCIGIIAFISVIIYLISCIYFVTNTKKLILDDKELILKNGIYFYNYNRVVTLKDFPTPYNKLDLPDDYNQENNIYITKDIPLELQLSNGEIYTCNYFIVSTFDLNWVLKNKQVPSTTIPNYSLNSYILDYVGTFTPEKLFKAETKKEIETEIFNWLVKNTKNKGIIIKAVKINTVFKKM